MNKYKINLNGVKFNITTNVGKRYKIRNNVPSIVFEMIQYHNDILEEIHKRDTHWRYETWYWKGSYIEEIKDES